MSAAPPRPVLAVERLGAVVVFTIDREHAGNSISAEVTAAFEAALASLDGDADLRAVVITGRGERFFSAGGDIKQYRALRTREQLEEAFARPRRVMDSLESLPVPVIAAVNGYALGGGAELMLAADLRVAATRARIGFPYVRLSLMPGWNGIERLARICGYGAAMHLLATGEPVSAEEARRLGLVGEVVEGDVREAALALARRFESTAPLALAACKRSLQAVSRLPAAEARAFANEQFAALWLSEDHREAEAAFAEKRDPRFRGR
jgi:enoyl-CoA hydratase